MPLKSWSRIVLPLLLAGGCALGCNEGDSFARVKKIESMAETIGGPAAGARPGDFLLENGRLRAVVHGRHNARSTFPLTNGGLIDLDIQRPQRRFGNGRGKDAFYELGAMVNLKLNNGRKIESGACGGQVGAAPCPTAAAGTTIKGCQRVSFEGPGENLIGTVGLLDLAVKKTFQQPLQNTLSMVTDYDVCPGEPFVRVTSTATFARGDNLPVIEMEPLSRQTGLLDVMLGEHTGQICKTTGECRSGERCDELLIGFKFPSLDLSMKRCRTAAQRLSGVMAGDYSFFSGKVNVFVPGNGFDHDSYVRSVFDSGGDIFSAPLTVDYVAAVADGVSYVYFGDGKMAIPVFAASFTVAMTHRFGCPRDQPKCIEGKRLRYRRYVSVGHGDVASALEGFYRQRKIATGTVVGNVLAARTHAPLSGVDVFAFSLPKAWQRKTDAEIRAQSCAARTGLETEVAKPCGFDELARLHRSESKTTIDERGLVGIVSQFHTDVGLDTIRDGSFSGPLPPGRYILVSRDKHRRASSLVPIRVKVGTKSLVSLIASQTGTLRYAIRDASGHPVPSKLTIGHCFPECARDADCSGNTPKCVNRLCTPERGYGGPTDCRPDQLWDSAKTTCVCPTTARRPLPFGGGRFADGTDLVELAAHGAGDVALPAGTYQVIASRGIEYDIDKKFVTVRPGVVSRVRSALTKVVDTRGWVSGDFHIHGPNSVDSGLTHHDRVVSYAAEGVEVMVSTDHDQLTDYRPAIFAAGLQPWVTAHVGLEVSPLEFGHFLGFPLRFDRTAELNGGFHWREHNEGAAQDWLNVLPVEIFQRLRKLGSLGESRTVVMAAHFYDYFQFYNVDPWTMNAVPSDLALVQPKVLLTSNFHGGFNAVEMFNGKNFDLIRRPTYKEIRDYSVALAALEAARKKDPQTITPAEFQRRSLNLSANAQRDFMRRTVAEQKLAIDFSNPAFECRCTTHAECGPGSVCDPATGGCIVGCASDADCNATLVTAKRESCRAVDAKTPAIKRCTRLAQTCVAATECTSVFGVDKTKETCTAKACELSLSCTTDAQCTLADPLRPRCDKDARRCTTRTAVGDLTPCPQMRGTIDDWFQMLNRGVKRAMVGNSDSHGTYDIEAGMPRNYLPVAADRAIAVTEDVVADGVLASRAFATYGPFVKMTMDGVTYGGTKTIKKGEKVSIKLHVQSPLWFDVDRIELYRNGDLIRIITGTATCAKGSADCIRVPNDAVVNFDATITDTPPRDAWYVAMVMGLDGKTLAPVYSSTPVSRLGIFELIQRLTPLLPPLRGLRTPLSPSTSITRPYSVANPIWVDVGGDGFTPLKPFPRWATDADRSAFGSKASGLRGGTGDPAVTPPSHDHRPGIKTLRVSDRSLQAQLARAGLSRGALIEAIERLRYQRGH